jgi:hypothetical protein
MKSKKYFGPVKYRFFQFVDELFHYLGIGYGTEWGRKFCLWTQRDVNEEWEENYD